MNPTHEVGIRAAVEVALRSLTAEQLRDMTLEPYEAFRHPPTH